MIRGDDAWDIFWISYLQQRTNIVLVKDFFRNKHKLFIGINNHEYCSLGKKTLHAFWLHVPFFSLLVLAIMAILATCWYRNFISLSFIWWIRLESFKQYQHYCNQTSWTNMCRFRWSMVYLKWRNFAADKAWRKMSKLPKIKFATNLLFSWFWLRQI